ncbi:uncharacterized protein STEHIDRAFT_155098 [Stereum hirsutum FP-91666 SS1]|uniref:uncharacterized protein n=1 Tax=Stereum hirsutum (strain FP-91666) TaxID=721885 RepID=UPI000440F5EC|nr:uncharacterized protein STEHIDRAFT_155098 [Stereum hirsutum FP-91666 SS1]EIM89438.1 hypothetical protein STEHIDRAFT_155098 [Stereum hirsutum FP-91666 SS1]
MPRGRDEPEFLFPEIEKRPMGIPVLREELLQTTPCRPRLFPHPYTFRPGHPFNVLLFVLVQSGTGSGIGRTAKKDEERAHHLEDLNCTSNFLTTITFLAAKYAV